MMRVGAAVLLVCSLQAEQVDSLKVAVLQTWNPGTRPHKGGRPMMVEIRDEANRIVPRARVQISTPSTGPSVIGPDSPFLVSWTDSDGVAHFDASVKSALKGKSAMIRALSYGRTGELSTDATPPLVMRAVIYRKPDHKLRNALIVAGAAGAVAAAVVLALTLGGGKNSSAVSIGSIAVGGPQ